MAKIASGQRTTELRPSGKDQETLRPGEPVPSKSEHQAGVNETEHQTPDKSATKDLVRSLLTAALDCVWMTSNPEVRVEKQTSPD